MDLMTQSTSYEALKDKYKNFSAPTVLIEVDGVELTQKLGVGVAAVAVDLTAGFAASGCSFDVLGQYQPGNSRYKSDAAGRLQLGAKVELKLGYVKTVSVFYGLIAAVEYVFDTEDAPYIHVECMDAKCLMMKTQRLDITLEQKVSQSITDILTAQPVSTYLKGRAVENLTRQEEMLPTAMETDYQFAVRQARYFGCEFFIIQGKAHFRKAPQSSSPVLSLAPRKGLRSARFSLRGEGLVNKVKVVGINPANDEAVKGDAAASGSFSSGSTASRMLGNSTKTYFEHDIETAGDASARAKALMGQIQSGFGRLTGTAVGLPELCPGRSLRVSGLMPEADVTAYLLEVRHTFDSRGFETAFEARIDKL